MSPGHSCGDYGWGRRKDERETKCMQLGKRGSSGRFVGDKDHGPGAPGF